MPNVVHLPEAEERRVSKLCDALTAAEVAILEVEPASYLGLLIQFEQAVEWLYNGKPYAGEPVVERLFKTLPARIERVDGEEDS